MPVTVAQPKTLCASEGLLKGTTDFTFAAVGDGLVAPFSMEPGSVSCRVDLYLTGEIGLRVRVRLTTSQKFPTGDAGLPGIIVVEGAYTMTARNEFVTIGAGPAWVAKWVTARVIVEALGPLGLPVTGTVEVNAHDAPSAPFRALGIGVVP